MRTMRAANDLLINCIYLVITNRPPFATHRTLKMVKFLYGVSNHNLLIVNNCKPTSPLTPNASYTLSTEKILGASMIADL